MSTKIQWVQNNDGSQGETWNPIVGCSKISEGCRNCYAERMAKRLKAMGLPQYQEVVDENGWTGYMAYAHDVLFQPDKWKKPRMIFVGSMNDLFHPSIPAHRIQAVMAIIATSRRHTFQILTKRAERMAEYCSENPVPDNVWLGVTAENQQTADERIPHLLRINASVRFVSVEPMLGAVDLQPYLQYPPLHDNYKMSFSWQEWRGLDWVICGGESGPNARPMHPDWARSLRDQCADSGTPFFFKQWGEWILAGVINGNASYKELVKVGKKAAGHLLDGVEWRQMPEA